MFIISNPTYTRESRLDKIEGGLPRIFQVGCLVVEVGEEAAGNDGDQRLSAGQHGEHFAQLLRRHTAGYLSSDGSRRDGAEASQQGWGIENQLSFSNIVGVKL